jgi:hypothetical protein
MNLKWWQQQLTWTFGQASQKLNNKLIKNTFATIPDFYVPATKWLEHLVVPMSVILK